MTARRDTSLAVQASEHDPLAGLLRQCAAGEEASFKKLYDLEAPRLYGIALRLTRDPQLAADATHDAFLQLWRKARDFDPSRGTARAWISSLLRYRAIDLLRRRAWEKTGIALGEAVDADADPLASLCANDAAAALRRCLEMLEPGPRRVVTLTFLEGLTHAQLAAALQAPLGTAKSWVRRALLSLRRCLDP